MSQVITTLQAPSRPSLDFFEYWDSLGLFEELSVILPPEFFVIFEIAQVVFTPELISEALNAVEDISREEKIEAPNRDESILVNRVERISPLSDIMVIDRYRTIYDLKKALPRELAWDDDIFDIKLFKHELLVQKFYEEKADTFKPISTLQDESGRQANRFDQKFYLLLDRSRSMEIRMRSFFSKCLVAEFLRRKLNSNAKIFYRPFDSKPGDLFKIEKKEDFPFLIERVLLTTTGGTSTNLQQAVFQAIDDIHYDKDMLNAEILVVTDGISKIDKYLMKEKLGDIKLNILKIGRDLAEPDYFEMKKTFDANKIKFDPTALNIKEIQQKMEKSQEGEEALSPLQKRAYRYILEYSETMFKDLKEISHRFVEIPDLDPSSLYELTDEKLDAIETAVDAFTRIDFNTKTLEERKKLFKQAYFLSQYVSLLLENKKNSANPILKRCAYKLQKITQDILADPSLLQLVMETGKFSDKETLKLSKKQLKEKLKEMKMSQTPLSTEEIRKAQMLLTSDLGEGNIGQFLRVLFIKLLQFIKRIVLKIKTIIVKKNN
ncbi:MAG: hypothetical protein GYA16_13995 [Spirochaetes bacterium]|nr:hypothetical protein [Spirochaetota bacterium]NMB65971.1 hypothetical protein [Spirochaetota bacterium]HOJ29517.1 hypothetical protein [Spirochaetota bacterium]HOM10656.1 hypothetical protein [Spirochaetota bacterium]HPP50476.1 hypothetical protein [Spirochaetota bacterium]